MFKKKVFRTLTMMAVGLLGFGLAHAGSIEGVDRLVERADDLTEHADAAIESSDGVVEALDALVEEVDAIVEDAIDLWEDEPDFSDEAVEHAHELIEAALHIGIGNAALVEEVYDVLLDANAKMGLAHTEFPAVTNGVSRKAKDAVMNAHAAVRSALATVCDSFDPITNSGPLLCPHTGDGAIGLAHAAHHAIAHADMAIENYDGTLGAEDTDPEFQVNTLRHADWAVEQADADVEASDAAIEAADAAIEAADKAIEKADRLVEAAGG